jgi:hypothetical protein
MDSIQSESDAIDQDLTSFRAWTVLMTTLVGIGFLSIPYCFRTGIITHSLLLVVLAVIADVTLILLDLQFTRSLVTAIIDEAPGASPVPAWLHNRWFCQVDLRPLLFPPPIRPRIGKAEMRSQF